jgi:hypothetical protein
VLFFIFFIHHFILFIYLFILGGIYVLQVSDYRRSMFGARQPHTFFDPTNADSQDLIQQSIQAALNDMLQFLAMQEPNNLKRVAVCECLKTHRKTQKQHNHINQYKTLFVFLFFFFFNILFLAFCAVDAPNVSSSRRQWVADHLRRANIRSEIPSNEITSVVYISVELRFALLTHSDCVWQLTL